MYEMATAIPILEYLSQAIKSETSDTVDHILAKILSYLTKSDGEIDHWLNPFFFATKYDLLETMRALIRFKIYNLISEFKIYCPETIFSTMSAIDFLYFVKSEPYQR